ncbi:MAG: hypothetical protein HY282_13890 [Nitrospirae bacterium]|nr:hypothetical protein [Candidatus Manganitrophaceae bacterium]
MRGAILLLIIGLFGCGYSAANHPTVDPGREISIPIFENGTFEPLLEQRVTESFKETFLRRGWKVTGKRDQPVMRLSGRVFVFERIPISLALNAQAQEYRIRIGFEYTLLLPNSDPPKQKEIAEATAEYIARPDPLTDRAAEDRAIREAAKRLAERVADRLIVKAPPPIPSTPEKPAGG